MPRLCSTHMIIGFSLAIIPLLTAAPRGQPLPDATWKTILSFRPLADVQRAIHDRGVGWAVHRIEDAKGGQLNLDYYSVNISRMPTVGGKRLSAEDLLAHVRRNLKNFVDNDLATFEPFEPRDAKRWSAADPSSAVLLIEIYLARNGVCSVPRDLPRWACPANLTLLDYASVVVSEASPTRFRFSTVKGGTGWTAIADRSRPGAHPVSGNREFGFSPRAAGGYSFYSIGADRATRSIDEFWGQPSLRDQGFLAGDALWRSYQARLAAFVNANGGEAELGFAESTRRDWNTASGDKSLYDTAGQPAWVPRADGSEGR